MSSGTQAWWLCASVVVTAAETVSYTEFLAACYSWQDSEINLVWSAFNKMDRDGDGKITIEEFISCLTGETSDDAHTPSNPSESYVMSRIALDKKNLIQLSSRLWVRNRGRKTQRVVTCAPLFQPW